MYGEDDMCPDCRLGDLQSTLDEVDYRLNPDTEAELKGGDCRRNLSKTRLLSPNPLPIFFPRRPPVTPSFEQNHMWHPGFSS